MADNREAWPALVRAGLIGLETRRAAVGFARVTIVTAIVCLACGFEDEWFFLFGGLLGLAAGWCFLSVWWVDSNSRWSAHRGMARRHRPVYVTAQDGTLNPQA
ncbi:MAG: hypothetical protein U0871_23430 [Gemmataceae bacterium]